MTKVIAVCGGNFGDEGKGLMVDYHASQYDNAIVIRSNGGAQAGHTVQTPERQRHVFSHFGSGTFTGTPTYLSEFFVLNPFLFKKEWELFVQQFGIEPEIHVSPNSVYTTPYDMLLNQSLETLRGEDPHGSCGVGFGETLERDLRFGAKTIGWLDTISGSVTEFQDSIYRDLDQIRKVYVPNRINMNEVSEDYFKSVLTRYEVIHDFIEACQFMLERVIIGSLAHMQHDVLIFEGAQGLMLDMDYGHFPHVTRSNCGMKNIRSILNHLPKIRPEDITVNYVTRAYSTRHGAGPLNGEDPRITMDYNINDPTNIPNEFQGKLRFAPLDLEMFNSITDKDFLNYAPRGSTKTQTITCLDQLPTQPDSVQVLEQGIVQLFDPAVFKEQMVPQMFDYGSYGPTRKDVDSY